MAPKDRASTLSPAAKKELKVIYHDSEVSDDLKDAFDAAYNELEQNYLQLKKNLEQYLASKPKHTKRG